VTPAPLGAVREALAGQDALLVGGAVRDQLLGREVADLDLLVTGDPRDAARAVARATGGFPFRISDAFGAWRIQGEGWNVDVLALEGPLEADLAARDFTLNAMAEPLAGGDVVDPFGGREAIARREIALVAEANLAADALRVLRAARLAVELGFSLGDGVPEACARHAPGLTGVAPERVFAELKRIVGADDPVAGMACLDAVGATAVVLPELEPLRGVEQNVFHHRDVHGHTLEVLASAAALERDPGAVLPRHGDAIAAWLAQPLGDGLTHGGALRFGALLHDVAKPATRGQRPDGRVTFVGHDTEGAEVAAQILRRLRASEKVVAHVAALTRHHLRLGFLVHERPITDRVAWRYLVATAPYAVDVTLLTVADRLATRGENAEAAIAAHLEVADAMLDHAFAEGPGAPLLRGDEIAAALERPPGPWLAPVLAQLEEDRYAGEISTRAEALERARSIASRSAGG
jgi:putative nucleotidyltransferase with HDIG domain